MKTMIKSTLDTKGFNAHTTGLFRIVNVCVFKYIYIHINPGSPNPPNCADWQKNPFVWKPCFFGRLDFQDVYYCNSVLHIQITVEWSTAI